MSVGCLNEGGVYPLQAIQRPRLQVGETLHKNAVSPLQTTVVSQTLYMDRRV